MSVARMAIALGAFVWLLQGVIGFAQMTGSWRPSPPNSKAIIYDEKGRRLYWDDNGQIVGRYSFATGKYISELPGKQRSEEPVPLRNKPNSPGENDRNLGIVIWGKAPDDQAVNRPQPKVISGPMPEPPTIVRHREAKKPQKDLAGDVAQDDTRAANWEVLRRKLLGLP